MRHMTLANANDIATWASTFEAPGLLPCLIRRLIYATADFDVRAEFRSNEGVRLPGWDGVVIAANQDAYVPGGTSGWEVSTQADPTSKANKEYKNRTANPCGFVPAETTLVHVTARQWRYRERWEKKHNDLGEWRQVRAYDAESLATWLELAPAVHVWFSRLIDKTADGVIDIESYWKDWAAETDPVTPSSLLVAGRSSLIAKITEWLDGTAPTCHLQSDSPDESLAVFGAILQETAEPVRETWLARALVVHTLEAWNSLVTPGRSELLLVPLFESSTPFVGRARRFGHRVLIPTRQGDSPNGFTVQVPKLVVDDAARALVSVGLPENRARELARLARRSLLSLRRELAEHAEAPRPDWARPENTRNLVALLLAGEWDTRPADTAVIAELATIPYEQVLEVVTRWAGAKDPPVKHSGGLWALTVKRDAWKQLEGAVTEADLERFAAVAARVLTHVDPQYELDDAERWMAGALGRALPHSRELRRGVAETLAIMASWEETNGHFRLPTFERSISTMAQQVFAWAGTDWKSWASLSDVLPVLAEAVPVPFLEALERGTHGERPVLRELFRETGNPLFSTSPHTSVLWALERLAWSPEHLARSAHLLATLARIDPGGTSANRPMNSLRSVLLGWHPQTMATVQQRLCVIDGVLRDESVIGWALLIGLLPGEGEIAFNNPRPEWRQWARNDPKPVTIGELREFTQGVFDRLLALVGSDGGRWRDLLEKLGSLDQVSQDRAIAALTELEPLALGASDRLAIWTTLRTELSRHRSYPDADWAMNPEVLERLASLYNRFEPGDPGGRWGWLFTPAPQLPDGEPADWKQHEAAIEEAQAQAMRSILETGNLPLVLRLVETVESPEMLGYTLVRIKELADDEKRLIVDSYLGTGMSPREQFGRAVTFGLERRNGFASTIEDLGRFVTTAAQRAGLYLAVRRDANILDLLDATDKATSQEFWGHCPAFGMFELDTKRVVRSLLRWGRTAVALHVLAHARKKQFHPALTAEVLEAFIRTPDGESGPMIAHHIAELMEALEQSNEIEDGRLASLEWGLLPLLDRRRSSPRRLHQELARAPGFFVSIVKLVYRAKGDQSGPISEQDRLRARNGHHLLEGWRSVPGLRADGSIDEAVLTAWVDEARGSLAAEDRAKIGDQVIGQVLSRAPEREDDAWPQRPIRNLLERLRSADVEKGFEIAVYNSRGVVGKSPDEGGVQEYALAERYEGLANRVADEWPRTGTLLRRLRDVYRRDGEREDLDAERFRDEM